MNILGGRWSLIMILAVADVHTAARADDFDIGSLSIGSSPDFTSDGVSASHSRWRLSLGGGGTFMSSKYNVAIPSVSGIFTVQNGNETDTLYIYNPTPSTVQSLGAAGTFEASLLYQITDGLNVGLLGGIDSGHQASEGFPVIKINKNTGEISNQTDYIDVTLHASKVVPCVELGPWMKAGSLRWRPHVIAGVGGFQINQRVSVDQGIGSNEVAATSQYYSGAIGGAGVSLSFSPHGLISLEARYERVFAPGQTLAFYVPTAQFGYLF